MINLTEDDLESMLEETYGSEFSEIKIPILTDEIKNVLEEELESVKFSEMWDSLNDGSLTNLDKSGKYFITSSYSQWRITQMIRRLYHMTYSI